MSSNLVHEPSSAPRGSGWLAPHGDTFLAELGGLGYAARTIGYYQSAIDGFCALVDARGLGAGEIGTEFAESRNGLRGKGLTHAARERPRCITRFIEHLIDAGAMAPPSPAALPEPGSLAELSVAYGDWLRHQRGLSPSTVASAGSF